MNSCFIAPRSGGIVELSIHITADGSVRGPLQISRFDFALKAMARSQDDVYDCPLLRVAVKLAVNEPETIWPVCET